MTVAELLSRMSSSELTEWMAYDRIQPFGDLRADLRAGIVASVAVNHSMAPPQEAAKPSDFMPYLRAGDDKPMLLEDPVEHGKLVARTLFAGATMKGKR